MKILRTLTPPPSPTHPVALTIGAFDGMHRGHAAVFDTLSKAGKTRVCLTFENHPSKVLHPDHPSIPLTGVEQRIALLKRHGVDILYLLPFTPEFASQEVGPFLEQLKQTIGFDHLVLGHDARIGKDKQGTPHVVEQLGDRLDFSTTYLPPVLYNDEPISSTRIRRCIRSGQLGNAEEMLGRKVSFCSVVHRGLGKGKQIGYPTANIEIDKVCIPPFGVYAVTLQYRGKIYPGVANLGVAPTIQTHRLPMLEVHLFHTSEDLYEHEVEVVLYQFLRPEEKFESVEELRAQITTDVASALRLFDTGGK